MTIAGTDKQVGAKYKYTDVITVGGVQVDAIVTIDAKDSGATISTIDKEYTGDAALDRYFAPEISGTSGQEVVVSFSIEFIDENDDLVTLQNFRVNSIDIDGPEFVEYGAFDSYTLGNPTDLNISSGGGNRIKFRGTGDYGGLIVNDVGRVQTTFGSVQSIQITMGVDGSNNNRQFGSAFKAFPFSGSTQTVSAPTVVAQTTSDTSPTITGTLTALSGSATFEVTVNGNTYASSGSDLTVTGSTWSLIIPNADELAAGTYDVTAVRKGTFDLPDQTAQELIINVNTAPVAVADSYTVNEGASLSGTSVLANDTDADTGDTLEAIKVSDPSNGTLTLNTDGTFTYVHNGGETTNDSFSYKANDGTVDSNTVNVSITVTPQNDAPVAVADSYTVNEGASLSGTSVLANDTDADTGDTLEAIKVSDPSNGTLTLNTDGTFTYVHNGGETTTDSFSYKANDSTVDSNTVNVSITVTPQNDAPIAVADSYTLDQGATLTATTVLANDSDADSNTLTAEKVTDPQHGTVTFNSNGTFTYVSDGSSNASDSFTYKASDSTAFSNTVAVSLTINLANIAPVAVNDTATVAEDGDTSVLVLANDSDADGTLISNSVTITSGPSHGTAVVNTSNGAITYTPAADYAGADSFSYKVKDNEGLYSNVASVALVVSAVNDAPVAVNDTATVAEDGDTSVLVLANDSDADGTLISNSVTITSGPSHGTAVVNTSNGAITYTPAADYAGADSFSYKVKDNEGLYSNVASVALVVSAVNDAPVAVNDTATVAEDGDTSVLVLANDSDADGTLISSSVTITSGPSHGTAVVNTSNGAITYTPAADYAGADSFSYKVKDNEGLYSNVASVALVVSAVNDAPVAVNDTATVAEDGDTSVLVLANDSDADGTLISSSVTITSGPSHGTAVVNTSNGAITYTPAADYAGADSFSYKVKDNEGLYSNVASVALVVSAVNDAPVAVNDTATVAEDGDTSVLVLANDSDADGTLISSSVTITSGPSHGTAVVNTSNGAITYTPAADYAGADSFSYKVKDNEGLYSNVASVALVVSAVNDAPVAVNDTATVAEDGDTSVLVLANDSDADGTLISNSVTITSGPSHGTAVVNTSNGAITYTPAADYAGADSLSYKVKDNDDDYSNIALLSITVSPVNDEPEDSGETVTIALGTELVTTDVLANASDKDGDTLTVTTATSADGDVLINDDGTISFFPSEGFSGTALVTYQVSDGQGGTVTSTLTIVVDAQNQPPIAVDDTFNLEEATEYLLDVLANDTDPEEDVLSITNARSDFGSVSIQGNKIKFTPSADATGAMVLSYRISDGFNEDATATVIVNLQLNSGPILTLPADRCGEFSENATALYTSVDLGQASAVDRFGNSLPVSLVSGNTLFAPGKNEAIWSATDADGKTTLGVQKVCVNPLVSIARDQTLLEGQSARVGVYLNGSSPTYPLVVAYSVEGSAQADDHDLVTGSISINEGSEGFISFDTLNDSALENDESIIISLSDSLNLGSKSVHTATITEGNIAPTISLSVSQQQIPRLSVSQTEGVVNVTARVRDPNPSDTLTYSWSASQSEVINQSNTNAVFSFDPSDLDLGVYTITLQVSDDGEGQLSDTESVYIEVVASLLSLTDADSDGDLIPDDVEGFKDSDRDGISDYLDRIMECNVLPEEVATQDGYLVEGDPGVCLRRGDFTIGKETGGAQLTDSDIDSNVEDDLVSDPDAQNIGGIFDYIAYGLPKKGTTYSIVIPQRRPVPAEPVYRKFTRANGWGFFIEDANNSIWSTAGEPGYCPPPNSNADQQVWTAGLTENHWCVQLVIEDGGPNDDDGLVNGTIVDPGGVSVMLSSNNSPIASNDSAQLYFNLDITIDALANDTDADGDLLVLSSVNAPIGTVEIIDGQVFYAPPLNYVGTVAIIYGVSDGNGGTDQGQINVDILPNSAPITSNLTSQINQGQTASVNLLSGASDPEGDTLLITAVDNASVAYDQSGSASFTPDPSFYGTVLINFTITDPSGNTVSGVWSIEVTQVFTPIARTEGGSVNLFLLILLGLCASVSRKVKGA